MIIKMIAHEGEEMQSITAHFGGWCMLCKTKWRKGAKIKKHGLRWIHAVCPRRSTRVRHEGAGRRP
jgi:hypothetical protein